MVMNLNNFIVLGGIIALNYFDIVDSICSWICPLENYI